MEIYGSGMLNFGYLGGVYDAGTGLIYMGNGQYYDPSTGRLLSLNMNVGQTNPNMPLNSDPAMMLISPLLLLGLVFGRKKEKSRIDHLLIIIVIRQTGRSLSLTLYSESISSKLGGNIIGCPCTYSLNFTFSLFFIPLSY